MVVEQYISSKKVLEYVKVESGETSDDKFIDKLMKVTLNCANDWDDYAIEPNTLKRMIKMCQTKLDKLED